MLYSIGYQKMKDPEELVSALVPHGITVLVDVRSKPNSRRFVFNRGNLGIKLPAAGISYLWWGGRLGGFAEIREEAIQELAEWQDGKTACLMCMEANPDQCHRKNEIGRRLGPYGVEVQHLPIKALDPHPALF